MLEVRAPGRVNLIGGQVDYHEGWVVSMAIDRDVRVTASARTDGRVVGRSRELPGAVDVAADGSDPPAAVEPPWGRLVAGVVQTLAEAGRPAAGADLEIASDVPIGAGLSSSAAFEVAVARVLCDIADFALVPVDLALAAQRAEHLALGVPCGIQDQLTSVGAQADHVLAIDCRTLEIEQLPLPDAVRVVIVHSGVARTLAGSPWLDRRTESLAIAERVGVRVLRDAALDTVRDEPRGRHVVTEMQRVLVFADALRRGDVDPLGPLMLASHASSRDDMEVSTPELDALVDCLVGAGALGARLTGGGFGGCVVALARAADAPQVAADATAAYRTRTGREPTPWLVHPSAGAGLVAR